MSHRIALPGMLLALLALAGCSHAAAPVASTPTPTPSAHPGPTAFVDWIRAQGTIGSKSFATATDDQILNFGNVVCGGFHDQTLTYGRIVQGLVESVAHPQASQAEAFVREATVNLCPEYEARLP